MHLYCSSKKLIFKYFKIYKNDDSNEFITNNRDLKNIKNMNLSLLLNEDGNEVLSFLISNFFTKGNFIFDFLKDYFVKETTNISENLIKIILSFFGFLYKEENVIKNKDLNSFVKKLYSLFDQKLKVINLKNNDFEYLINQNTNNVKNSKEIKMTEYFNLISDIIFKSYKIKEKVISSYSIQQLSLSIIKIISSFELLIEFNSDQYFSKTLEKLQLKNYDTVINFLYRGKESEINFLIQFNHTFLFLTNLIYNLISFYYTINQKDIKCLFRKDNNIYENVLVNIILIFDIDFLAKSFYDLVSNCSDLKDNLNNICLKKFLNFFADFSYIIMSNLPKRLKCILKLIFLNISHFYFKDNNSDEITKEIINAIFTFLFLKIFCNANIFSIINDKFKNSQEKENNSLLITFFKYMICIASNSKIKDHLNEINNYCKEKEKGKDNELNFNDIVGTLNERLSRIFIDLLQISMDEIFSICASEFNSNLYFCNKLHDWDYDYIYSQMDFY